MRQHLREEEAQERMRAARHTFGRTKDVVSMPNLNQVQRDSFDSFIRDGLRELFAEVSPIQDATGRNMDLELAVPAPDSESSPRTTEV